ncbi:hypothetical protein F7P69_00805 [Cellulosimicrobium funkei]|nr:hypothetical protein [Cellulosimicrobium funkei]
MESFDLTSLGLLVSWMLGGAGLLGVIMTALQIRGEDKRWLKGAKKDAYAHLLTYASTVREKTFRFSRTADELNELQKIYVTGNLNTPLELPSLGYPEFKNFEDVRRAKQKLTDRLAIEHDEFREAMRASSDWEGTMDLMATRKVTMALNAFFISIGILGESVGETVTKATNSGELRSLVGNSYEGLRAAIRKDFGTKDN